MGIPSYFSYIIKNYPNIIRNLEHFVSIPFHHLYMDCNSIVYDAVHAIEKEIELGKYNSNSDFETDIIKRVIENIKGYIKIISPSETAYIAFDGVAPFAKMDQQRTRRYKSAFLSKITFDTSVIPKKEKWNTSAITPGTAFMEKLSIAINYEFKHSEGKHNVKHILVSCCDECGEGEHKLYEHMRKHNNVTDNIAVYGLDADLIMLSIFHLKYAKNIYVFREAPEFLKSSIPISVQGNETEPHFLDIRHLASCISAEMQCKFSDPHRINDYVFLCFLLGNDFLPHFPAMNIRTHGIQALMDIYRLFIGNHVDRFFISKTTGKIQWRNVGIFVNEVAKREHEFLMNEYFVRGKFDKRIYAEVTPKDKDDILQNVPTICREEEKYICPSELGWEKRYYKILFHGAKRTTDTLKPICNNYLEGLEWTFKYYTGSCPDWRWKYNYNYPPLFVDLCKYIPHFETDFITFGRVAAFSTNAQLSYVLPGENLYLLPDKISAFLKTNYKELYPEQYDFQWTFCRYLWEAHPKLPEISLELLEQLVIQFRLCDVK